MIVLNTATRSLEYLLSGSVSANQLPFVVNYVNTTREGQNHPNSANGTSNNTTAVTILGAPSAGEKRNVQALNIYNADTASVTVTVRLNDNTTMRNIVVVTLSIGDTLIYTSASGWFVLTASGFIKSTSTAVNLDDLGDVIITSPATNAVFIYNGTNWVDQDQANVVNGGTGRATATAYAVLTGGTTATGAHQSIASVGTAGQVLTSNGAGNLPTFQTGTGIILGTEVASTSGTSIDFTGIPAGVKRIAIILNGVSTNGTSNLIVQIGDSDGVETASYVSRVRSGGGTTAATAGFIFRDTVTAADVTHGHLTILLEDSSDFTWSENGIFIENTTANEVFQSAGSKSLSAELDRVRITTANGTDAFDAGVINIQYQS